ncbi:outer membrane beta-barrel protein [Pseudoroseicyclus aestuarii]|uniref:Lipid A oxidase n=1 Tax=Pseudoroseicyclus aestuarii TaxID=1795041 RepID=A0A318SS09_9RHOB|nr:outer membrane beta-barrel protein [Pseudoroseicyclus aestuarii]PYE84332.1 lipid A oxidase [Pseudoroseicyclus aestuarii]
MRLSLCLPFLALIATPAAAEIELGVYGGAQSAPHSEVEISDDSVIGDTSFTAGWDGNSFEAPPYYGVRGTWWRSESLGFGLDFTHQKIYADDETLAESGLDRLEFTDGLNVLTANVWYRWPEAAAGLTPYVGGGLGVAVPHVEVETEGSSTGEYQITGPAAAVVAGASWSLNSRWSVFGEYKGTYSQNEAELDTGGTLDTDVVTNAVNLGVSFNF